MTVAVRLPAAAKGARPMFLQDQPAEHTLSIALALAGEVAVLRERLDTLERLLAAKQAVSPAIVDAFTPDSAVQAERDAWREQFLEMVLRSIHQEIETMRSRAAEKEPQRT